MNKLKSVWEQRKKVIIFCLIACLYSCGGGGWLVLRRYLMPALITKGVIKEKGVLFQLGVFMLLAFPLHLGYTTIVDGEQYLKITLLGLFYGLSWVFILKWRVLLSGLILATILPVVVVLDKRFGL
ncbi:MAG: hypothetical protein ABIH71_05645, partial [Candidatus Omnitrophota bacterium]